MVEKENKKIAEIKDWIEKNYYGETDKRYIYDNLLIYKVELQKIQKSKYAKTKADDLIIEDTIIEISRLLNRIWDDVTKK